MYQSYLGMAGNPVEYTDRYELSDRAAGPARGQGPAPKVGVHATELDFARYGRRIEDITAGFQELPPSMNRFPTKYARRTTTLTFNVADYSRQLVTDFLIEGGKIEPVEFHSPSELGALPQRVIINCTGYGARALWKDESVIPVRGQIAWLIPQPEVNYGFYYSSLNVLGRRDGIVVQAERAGRGVGVGGTRTRLRTAGRLCGRCRSWQGCMRGWARLLRWGRSRGRASGWWRRRAPGLFRAGMDFWRPRRRSCRVMSAADFVGVAIDDEE